MDERHRFAARWKTSLRSGRRCVNNLSIAPEALRHDPSLLGARRFTTE